MLASFGVEPREFGVLSYSVSVWAYTNSFTSSNKNASHARPCFNSISIESETVHSELSPPLVSLSTALAEATATVSIGISTSDEPDLALIRSSCCLNMLGHPVLVPSSAPVSQPAMLPPNLNQHQDDRDDWAHHIA